MDNITGYQYIDLPTTKLLESLPNDIREKLTVVIKQIHSAGKAEGYAYGKYGDDVKLDR